MRLSRPVKVILGAATLWPALWLMALAVSWFVAMSNPAGPSGRVENTIADTIWMLRWTFLLFPLLAVFYLVYLFRMPTMTGAAKGLWAAAILVGCGPLFMPLFFFLHIWRDSGSSGR